MNLWLIRLYVISLELETRFLVNYMLLVSSFKATRLRSVLKLYYTEPDRIFNGLSRSRQDEEDDEYDDDGSWNENGGHAAVGDGWTLHASLKGFDNVKGINQVFNVPYLFINANDSNDKVLGEP